MLFESQSKRVQLCVVLNLFKNHTDRWIKICVSPIRVETVKNAVIRECRQCVSIPKRINNMNIYYNDPWRKSTNPPHNVMPIIVPWSDLIRNLMAIPKIKFAVTIAPKISLSFRISKIKSFVCFRLTNLNLISKKYCRVARITDA